MSKERIVFLPGLSCDQRLFSHQIRVLGRDFNTQTIVCDTADTMQGHIQNVLSQIEGKFILIGHSFGGWVAQWVAIYAPERVSKLILMGTGTGQLTPDLRNIFEDMHRSFKQNEASAFLDKVRSLTVYGERIQDVELMNAIKVMQDEAPIQGLLNQVATDLEGKDTTSQLHTIRCNTLLIHGKHDAFYDKDMALLKERIPHNDSVEMDHCGHMIPMENPEGVTALIQLWLNQRR